MMMTRCSSCLDILKLLDVVSDLIEISRKLEQTLSALQEQCSK
jgi:hypothetical protein